MSTFTLQDIVTLNDLTSAVMSASTSWMRGKQSIGADAVKSLVLSIMTRITSKATTGYGTKTLSENTKNTIYLTVYAAVISFLTSPKGRFLIGTFDLASTDTLADALIRDLGLTAEMSLIPKPAAP